MREDRALGAPRRSSGRRPAAAAGRVLVAVYGTFALAAGARAAVQLATRFDEAPLAYLLSAFAAVVYVVATVGLVRGGRGGRRTALVAITVELVGVLVVGHAVAGRPGGLPRRDGVVGVRPRLLLRPAGAAGARAAAAAPRGPAAGGQKSPPPKSPPPKSPPPKSPPPPSQPLSAPPAKSPPGRRRSRRRRPGAVLVALGVGLLVPAAEQAAVAQPGVEQRVGDGGADDQAADRAEQAAADHAAHAGPAVAAAVAAAP